MSVATARQGELFIAVGAAVALHGVGFAVLVLLALADILIDAERAGKPTRLIEPGAAVVELSPEYFRAVEMAPEPRPAVPAPAEEPPPPDGKAFLKTDRSQASETPPPQAAFIGERDTRAANDGAVDPNSPPVPSQDGEEQRRDELNLFDSSFNDGEEPGDRTGNQAEPEKLAGTPVDGTEGEGEPSEPEEVPEPGQPKDTFLASQDEAPVPAREGTTGEARENTLPQESRNQSEAETARRGEEGTARKPPEEQLKKSGFRTEARKTRIRGSLKRRGRSALDVENTAVGRYRARVYRVIEREWQKQCITYRNHILPGSLTLRFFVGREGEVSGLRYIYEFQTSEIQKGFSVMSVR
ncbi:MAG: hypothetical protein GWO24_00710, partial [Akkermansiaceae bacterium]|nr:hypothetical protein [Akkermansiaceae bacterium]